MGIKQTQINKDLHLPYQKPGWGSHIWVFDDKLKEIKWDTVGSSMYIGKEKIADEWAWVVRLSKRYSQNHSGIFAYISELRWGNSDILWWRRISFRPRKYWRHHWLGTHAKVGKMKNAESCSLE